MEQVKDVQTSVTIDEANNSNYAQTSVTVVDEANNSNYAQTSVTVIDEANNSNERVHIVECVSSMRVLAVRAYGVGNDLLNKHVFQDQEKESSLNPIFSKEERWNIFCYIVGIMLYKFGLEQYNGTVKALALDRFSTAGLPVYTYTGYLDGFQACTQCIGAIIVGPFMRLFPVKTILAFFLFAYAIISCIIMIIEGATGGTMPTKCVSTNGLPPVCTGNVSGDWNPIGILPVYVLSGIPYGGIELIRRVIPQRIVGSKENRLKKLDALVHIYYEVAGTLGALAAAYVCLTMGKAFAPIITPIFFVFSALLFSQIKMEPVSDLQVGTPYELVVVFGVMMKEAFFGFFEAIIHGGRIVLGNNSYFWLIGGYSVPLVMHRYIENGICAVYAKLVLGESAYASFLVSGSNLGELLGAAFVFVNLNYFFTPLPTLRWDALALNFTWLFKVATPQTMGIPAANAAGVLAAIMLCISAGWAAGDVSLSAFIQRQVQNAAGTVDDENALPAVMSFLYVIYIIIYAVLSPMIGNWLDGISRGGMTYTEAKTCATNKLKIYSTAQVATCTALKPVIKQAQIDLYFYWIGGVFFSVMCIVIFANTFLPKGSWAFNPTLAYGGDTSCELEVVKSSIEAETSPCAEVELQHVQLYAAVPDDNSTQA